MAPFTPSVRSLSIFVVVGISILAVGVVQAQPGGPPAGPPGCDPGPVAGLLSQFGRELGRNLGATEEQIREAVPATLQAMRPQIEAQVRQLCARAPTGAGPGAGLPLPPEVLLGATAQALQLDPATLRSELQQGKTLAQIAQSQGVDADALADQLTAAAEQYRLQQERQAIRRLLDLPPGSLLQAPSR